MKRAIIITTDNTIYTAELTDDITTSLKKELDADIVAPIYPRHLRTGFAMMVDDDGRIDGKPVNHIATAIYDFNEPICGDVAIVRETYIGKVGAYELAGLTEPQIRELLSVIAAIAPNGFNIN